VNLAGRPARGTRFTASSGFALLAVLVVVVAVASAATRITSGGLQQVATLVAFAVAIAVGECLRVWLPGDREAAPVGTASGVAFALISGAVRGQQGALDPALVIAVIALATLLGLLPHLLAARTPDLDGVVHRFLAVALLVVAWRALPVGRSITSTGYGGDAGGARWAFALAMVAAVVATLVVDATLAAAMRATREKARLGPVLRDELRAALGLGSAIGSSGVLIALAAGPMGLLALPVFLAPLLLTQFAFRRYASIQATYVQTIRSLSRVTELGGYTETGHSRRVAAIAQAVGRDLGLSERALQDLEYAALLHDIGQLSLTEPIPGGATLMAAPLEQRRIADLGAAVVRRTGVLDEVATIIQRQTEPYRRQHEVDDVDVPLASRIIKAANAYDDLVGEAVAEARQREALERIHLGLAYEYDPRVVRSLTRVVLRER
jgi:hypothetical protein